MASGIISIAWLSDDALIDVLMPPWRIHAKTRDSVWGLALSLGEGRHTSGILALQVVEHKCVWLQQRVAGHCEACDPAPMHLGAKPCYHSTLTGPSG